MNNRSGAKGPRRLSTPMASNAGKIVPELLFRSIAAVTSLLLESFSTQRPGVNNRPLSWGI